MSVDTASLSVTVTSKGINETSSKLDGLSNSAKKTESSVRTATGRMKSHFSKLSTGITSAIGKMRGGISNFTQHIFSLKSALLGLGVAALAKDIYKTAASFESMENTMIAATGSVAAGGTEMKYAMNLARQLGLNVEKTVHSYAGLTAAAKGSTLAGQSMRDTFTAVARASASLSLTGSETASVIYAISQMVSKGKVSMEELRRQLGERLPGAFVTAAKAMGLTTMQLDKMVSTGQLMTEDFLPKFTKAIEERFGGGVERAMHSARANLQRFDFDVKMLKLKFASSGFMDFASKAMQQMQDAMNDPAVQKSIEGIGSALSSAAEDGGGLVTVVKTLLSFTKYLAIGFKTVGSVISIAGAKLKELGADMHADRYGRQLERVEKIRKHMSGEDFNLGVQVAAIKNGGIQKYLDDQERILRGLKRNYEAAQAALGDSTSEVIDRKIAELDKFIKAINGPKVQRDNSLPDMADPTGGASKVELAKQAAESERRRVQAHVKEIETEMKADKKLLASKRNYYNNLVRLHNEAFTEMTKQEEKLRLVRKHTEEDLKLVFAERDKVTYDNDYDKRFAEMDKLEKKRQEAIAIKDPDARISELQAIQDEWVKLSKAVNIGDDIVISYEEASARAAEAIKSIGSALEATHQEQLNKIKEILAKIDTEKAKAWEDVSTLEQKLADLNAQKIELAKTVTVEIQENVTTVVDKMAASIRSLKAEVIAFKQVVNQGSSSVSGSISSSVSYDEVGTMNLPEYSKGTPFVPKDGVYKLHKGEQVVPKRDVAAQSSQVTIAAGAIQINVPESSHVDADSLARQLTPAIRKYMKRIGG